MIVKRALILRTIPLFGFVLLTSCARQQKIDRDNLQSDFTSGISLASEARLYLEYAAEGRASGPFSEGHLHYLTAEAKSTTKELQQGVASSEDAEALHQARLQFEELSEELARIAQNPSDANARIGSVRHLDKIGEAMEKAKSSL